MDWNKKENKKKLKDQFTAWLKNYLAHGPPGTPKEERITYSNYIGKICAWKQDIQEDIQFWEKDEYPNLRTYVNSQ